MARSIFADIIPFQSGAFGASWGSVVLPSPSAGSLIILSNTDKANDLRLYISDMTDWHYITMSK